MIWRRRVRTVLSRITSRRSRPGTHLRADDENRIGAFFVAAAERALVRAPHRRSGAIASNCAASPADAHGSTRRATSCSRQSPLALLVPQQLAVAIDRWHAHFGAHLLTWVAAVGDLEALSSLATYTFEHPADPFPVLVDAGPLFDAQGLAHPLMAEAASVRNDVALAATKSAHDASRANDAAGLPRGFSPSSVIIISGSNMSGKSTLLRVRRHQRGPRARRRAGPGCPPSALAAGDRRDPQGRGLASGRTLALLRGDSADPCDRRRARADRCRCCSSSTKFCTAPIPTIGGSARKPSCERSSNRGAVGLVTTHDLALTELADRLGATAVNMHFEDRLEAGRMRVRLPDAAGRRGAQQCARAHASRGAGSMRWAAKVLHRRWVCRNTRRCPTFLDRPIRSTSRRPTSSRCRHPTFSLRQAAPDVLPPCRPERAATGSSIEARDRLLAGERRREGAHPSAWRHPTSCTAQGSPAGVVPHGSEIAG